MVQVYVYNKSTVVTNNETAIMVAACNILIKKFCFIWNILPVTITHLTTIQDVNYIFYIVDNTIITPNMLTCFTNSNGKFSGYILAKNIINNGGVPLYLDATTYTVAAALFSQIAETILDPSINIWWRLNAISTVAGDVCNPVFGNLVIIPTPSPKFVPNINQCKKIGQRVFETPSTTANTVNVALCDFLYPSWYDPNSVIPSNTIFNYLNTLTKPFMVSNNGYVAVLNTVTNTLVYTYGINVPLWLRTFTQNTLRNAVRRNYVASQSNIITFPPAF
jgi:hypothetical protein